MLPGGTPWFSSACYDLRLSGVLVDVPSSSTSVLCAECTWGHCSWGIDSSAWLGLGITGQLALIGCLFPKLRKDREASRYCHTGRQSVLTWASLFRSQGCEEHLELCVKSVCLFVCHLWDFLKKINSGFCLFVCFGFVFILPYSSGG